jgi:hypothetical protein
MNSSLIAPSNEVISAYCFYILNYFDLKELLELDDSRLNHLFRAAIIAIKAKTSFKD